jgi:hypothetical protein
VATLGWALVYLAVGMLAVGLLWGILKAFDKSIGWGLIALFLAPAGTAVFLLLTIRDNYKPFLLVAGALLLLSIAGTIVW